MLSHFAPFFRFIFKSKEGGRSLLNISEQNAIALSIVLSLKGDRSSELEKSDH
ncbi:MAG: hypothetical protein VKL42_01355 [Snowella sp.]|nr:hypothetical protein [Snowella sp.]